MQNASLQSSSLPPMRPFHAPAEERQPTLHSPPHRTEPARRIPGWAEKLVRVLDDYGLDAIAGFFFPVVGDAITGASSMTLLALALRERVPTIILLKMLLNILVDTLVGCVPMVGDFFDLFWRANRKNLELIERYGTGAGHAREKPSGADYAIVGVGLLLIVASVVLPFLILGSILSAIASAF